MPVARGDFRTMATLGEALKREAGTGSPEGARGAFIRASVATFLGASATAFVGASVVAFVVTSVFAFVAVAPSPG